MKLHDRFYIAGVVLCGMMVPSLVLAQIVPDRTLGVESSQVKPDVEIRGDRGTRIEGGAVRGSNLFHSFQEFNINEGQRVYFANPTAVQNILTRVTGGNPSNILGTLGVDGSANLFLLNPNGILFGQNARLDISGSFVGTTGRAIAFPDGSEFSATQPQSESLLSIHVPSGLQYGANPGSRIVSIGNLSVGQDLTLAADTLQVQGQLQAGRDLTLRSPHPIQGQNIRFLSGRDFGMGDYQGSSLQVNAGGNINYGTVVINAIDPTVNPTYPAVVLRSGGQITGTGNLSTTASDGGLQVDLLSQRDLNIRGITTQGGAIHLTSVKGGITTNGVTLDTTNGARDGGAIELSADGNIAIGDLNSFSFAPYGDFYDFPCGLYVCSYRLPSVSANGGAITIGTNNGNITAHNLNAYSETSVFSQDDRSSSGNGGAIRTFTGNGSITTRNLNAYSRSRNAGNGGAITSTAINGRIIAHNLSSWSSDSSSYGPSGALPDFPTFARDGGAITLSATNGITTYSLRAVSSIRTRSSPSTGNGGSITLHTSEGNIIANSLETSSVAYIDNFSCRNCFISAGNSGDISLSAPHGSITVHSDIGAGVTAVRSSEFLRNGSYKNVSAGDSGTITIFANSDIHLGTSIITTGNRNGGSITILTPNGSITTTGPIYAIATRGIGGAVTLSASNGSIIVPVSKPDYFAPGIYTFSNHNLGGDITLSSRNNILLSTLNTSGVRGSGNITVTTEGNLSMLGNSVITTDTFGSGRGGNITLTGQSIAITNGSQLSASTHGRGQAGNITLNALDSIQLSGIAPGNEPPVLLVYQSGLVGVPEKVYVGGYLPTGDARNFDTDDRSTIFPSGVFTQTTRGSSGNSGNINIQTDRLMVQDGAAIGISTFGRGSSGNVAVHANSILLDNGTITASTVSQGGGNITFDDVRLLQLRHNSLISAEAQNQANGGNITINADNGFLIASPTENNDIIARAAAGRGGNITIPALGILGLEEGAAAIGNYTSDLDASGQTPGTVTINGLNTDPSRSLAALPTNITDRSNQISQNCAPQTGESSRFVATGRGGLPLSPDQPLRDRAVLTPEWVTLDTTASETVPRSNRDKILPQDSVPNSAPAIVEANGWRVDAQGKVALIDQTQPLDSVPHRSDRVCLGRSR